VRGGGGCRAGEMAVVAGCARGMQGGPKPDDDDNISLFLVVGLGQSSSLHLWRRCFLVALHHACYAMHVITLLDRRGVDWMVPLCVCMIKVQLINCIRAILMEETDTVSIA
jgi:hypothetical protein